tara:strand:- start:217 stop:330 length:114 start_codon:yes stop_codon:yes gene_type:complete
MYVDLYYLTSRVLVRVVGLVLLVAKQLLGMVELYIVV